MAEPNKIRNTQNHCDLRTPKRIKKFIDARSVTIHHPPSPDDQRSLNPNHLRFRSLNVLTDRPIDTWKPQPNRNQTEVTIPSSNPRTKYRWKCLEAIPPRRSEKPGVPPKTNKQHCVIHHLLQKINSIQQILLNWRHRPLVIGFLPAIPGFWPGQNPRSIYPSLKHLWCHPWYC